MMQPDDGLSLEEIRIVHPEYPTGTRVIDESYREHAIRVKEFYLPGWFFSDVG